MRERILEVEYLSALGINVLDSTIARDHNRLEVLPELERLTHYRWNRFYYIHGHTSLTLAITKELLQQYNNLKNH